MEIPAGAFHHPPHIHPLFLITKISYVGPSFSQKPSRSPPLSSLSPVKHFSNCCLLAGDLALGRSHAYHPCFYRQYNFLQSRQHAISCWITLCNPYCNFRPIDSIYHPSCSTSGVSLRLHRLTHRTCWSRRSRIQLACTERVSWPSFRFRRSYCRCTPIICENIDSGTAAYWIQQYWRRRLLSSTSESTSINGWRRNRLTCVYLCYRVYLNVIALFLF